MCGEIEIVGRMLATGERLDDIVDVMQLETPEQEQHAARVVRVVETLIKESEAERKHLVAPLKEEARAIDLTFRGPRQKLEALSRKIRYRLSEVAEARERARIEAIRKAQAAKTPEEANGALSAVREHAPDTPGVSVRWRWELDAIDDPDAVPRDILTIDLDKIRDLCRTANSGGPEPSVPGLRFKKTAHHTVRRVKSKI